MMVSHRRLSDNKSSLFVRTPQDILTDIISAVICWMSILPPLDDKLFFVVPLSLAFWPGFNDLFVFQSPKESVSWTDYSLCVYLVLVWSNFNLLHNSQRIIFPSQSCQILYSFCANFNYHYYYHSPREFFTPALAGLFSVFWQISALQ